MTTIYDYDLHGLGEAAFRSIQSRAIRDAGYDPTASSLTRQAWAYQQELIDEMGEGLGQADAAALAPKGPEPEAEGLIPASVASRLAELGIDKRIVSSCGAGLLTAAFAGYVTGKVGVLPVAAGVGVAFLVLRGMEPRQ